jgi:hypothetical protein
MSSPDFSVMTEQELRAYVLSHREDKAAFEAYLDKVHERPPIAVIEPEEWSEERMQAVLNLIKQRDEQI